jgi:hypothetical protein
MTTDFADFPEGVKFRKYTSPDYYFAYPDGGLFAEFDHPDGTHVTRLVMDYDDTQFRVNLERMPEQQSAREMAERVYNVNPSYPENIAPERVPTDRFEGWRMRHLFSDNGADMMLIDTVFIEATDRLYRLQFAADPDEYEKGRWMFEAVLRSLHFEG